MTKYEFMTRLLDMIREKIEKGENVLFWMGEAIEWELDCDAP